jgi:hypothetical protein
MDIRLPALGNRVKMDIRTMHQIKNIMITPEILKLIADIDEFIGRWKAMQNGGGGGSRTFRRYLDSITY